MLRTLKTRISHRFERAPPLGCAAWMLIDHLGETGRRSHLEAPDPARVDTRLSSPTGVAETRDGCASPPVPLAGALPGMRPLRPTAGSFRRTSGPDRSSRALSPSRAGGTG